ncbi:16S rRNA (uracil(1498)-N(3))-methyltransferase [Rufibacter roseus]|uniref:Ribosomal RNA small subunit methyltransferase E n=1 Tax=Rufibacter roseus TaxID=1567108 RepID=A0ABW2DTM0_9BACT|nr:16S rRNA (uracil(1498)-N(3))-methyltransferase [Rufibacter roseus]
MNLFYTPNLQPNMTEYVLSEEESKHCSRVLRLGVGDKVQLIDGRGGFFEAEISDAAPKKTKLRILNYTSDQDKRSFRIHIAVAPTKNMDRMEWFVEKAVELGIDEISLLQCARSERKNINLDRLEKIAISAMKQSMKSYLPKINELTRYEDFISQRFSQNEHKFIAHLVEGQERFSLAKSITGYGTYTILIGPEGDFSPEEVEQALQAGFKPVTLGSSRLRTETAALAACHTIHVVLDV